MRGLARRMDRRLLPLVLLLAALAAVFVFGNDRDSLYRSFGPSDELTSKYVGLAANISPEHNFLVFHWQTEGADGRRVYAPYNRFPIGGYLLIKLAILPFGEDLPAQILAARMLMLLAFAATAVLAYLSLSRITQQRWIALTATLLTFASTMWLYSSDMVATELGLDFFGVMLTFHGIVVFAQEGRFRQLLVKTCAALLLGWHVYGLLGPFIVLGLAQEVRTAWAARVGVRRAAAALLRSRYLALAAVSLLFGLAVLSINFVNEYAALGDETPLTELPSVQSMLRRFGQDEHYSAFVARNVAWSSFLPRQLHRIGGMSLPYALPGFTNAAVGWPEFKFYAQRVGLFIGLVVVVACALGLARSRHKLLLGTLALSGLGWTVPMRYTTAVHNFEALSYTGIPLVFFTLALVYARRWMGDRILSAAAAAALLIFVYSSYQMACLGYDDVAAAKPSATKSSFHTSCFGHDEAGAKFRADVMADFQTIRGMTKEQLIFVQETPPLFSIAGELITTHFFLTGRNVAYATQSDWRELADVLITNKRIDGPALLTPDNRRVFLYDRAAYDRQFMAELQRFAAPAGEPIIRAAFDVYRRGNQLIYARDACQRGDLAAKFFLHVFPADAESDLPELRRRYTFDNWDFDFALGGTQIDGVCLSVVDLPNYPIASIRTGQYVPGKSPIWEAEASFGRYSRAAGDRPSIAELQQFVAAAGEPLVRAEFDVYRRGNQLVYARDACQQGDLAAKFFLHVYPADESDLPEPRRRYGFDNWDFDFALGGTQIDGACLTVADLPSYPIAFIRTGQYVDGEGRLWEAEASFGEP